MQKNWSRFSLNIILPSVISLLLFIVLIFFIIIPYFEESILERKKEMIKELTNSAWSILKEKESEVQDSLVTIDKAQQDAILVIKNLKYGEGHKDYFWITDMQPKMVIHPYRPELKGKDLSDYTDPNGKKLFVECVNAVKNNGEGYVEYMWQYKEDSSHIVPKLSYVKAFESWGWVIGTGIYIEDVKQQMAALTNRLLLISLIIALLIGLILFYLVRSNLVSEKKRIQVNWQLQESFNKYKTLVEASTEGIVVVVNKQKVFYNLPILQWLGYSTEEFDSLRVFDVLHEKELFENLVEIGAEQQKLPKSFDTRLIKKNGDLHNVIVSVSRIDFHGEEGFIFAFKDVEGKSDIAQRLDENIEKFKAISNNVDIGIFRTSIGRRAHFVEVNKRAVEIIGGKSDDDLYKINLFDLFYSLDEKKEILEQINANTSVKKQIVRVKCLDGSVITALVSLFPTLDDENKSYFCDGIIQDVTQQKLQELQKESITEELLATSLFMNQPLKSMSRKIPSCHISTPINRAIKTMIKKNVDALLVYHEESTPLGIVTNNDFGERIIANQTDLESPVSRIMSSPLICLPENAMLFEVLLKMREKDVSHVCVENVDGSITDVINIKELAHAKNQTPTLIIQQIRLAETYEELKEVFKSIPVLLRMMIESGAKADIITRINSNFSDEIANRLLEIILKNEEPPTSFAIITLGSVGRGEQTLVTDQDNALIYNDVQKNKTAVKNYFLKLAELFNKQLDEIGYQYCKGEVMAKNPKWCLSLSEWKEQFRHWIENSSPKDLLEVNIFFDIQKLYGRSQLVDDLQDSIYDLIIDKQVFYYHLAETILAIKQPISFFGNFVVESTKENKSVFDIKKVIMSITGIARLYSLKHQVKVTNTLQRLQKLNANNHLTDGQYQMLTKSYNYLMLMRLNHQLKAIIKQKEPNNLINPKQLNEIERTSLKKIFAQLTDFYTKVSLDFKGSI